MNATLSFRSMFYLVLPDEVAAPTLRDVPNAVENATVWFFVFIALEFVIGLMKGSKVYRLNDFTTSLNLGSVQQMVSLWTKAFLLSLYIYTYDHYRVVDIPPTSVISFLGCMTVVDFAYYWNHRFLHEFHAGWATHSVHHSGEDYNLATALRQGAMQWFFGFFFNIPLALFFHPAPFVVHSGLNLIYQFWIHTPLVGRLPFGLEYVLNTASHHRMHHRYPGNCNYAGFLIVWDRMFATFVAEERQVDAYGLAKQIDTFDPLVVQTEHARRMVSNIKNDSLPSLLFKRRCRHPLVFRPLLLLKPLPPPEASLWQLPKEAKRKKFDGAAPLSWFVFAYVLVQEIAVLTVFILLGPAVQRGDVFAPTPTPQGANLLCVQALLFALVSCTGRLCDGSGKRRNLARALGTVGVLYAMPHIAPHPVPLVAAADCVLAVAAFLF